MKTYTLALALATLTIPVGFAADTLATPSNASSTGTAQVEQIVRNYIMEHPEVMLQSLEAYSLRAKKAQEQAARENVEANLKELHSNSPVAGDTKSADAVTVVEFFDYRCGYCKKMQDVIAGVVNKPGVRLVYKDLPILGPESVLAARAALAAEKQGAYQQFHHRLMTANEITAEAIDQIAGELKLDVARLKKDMASPEVAATLAKNQQLAEKLGVTATPYFVIGKDIAPGALPEQALQEAIQKARGAAQTAQADTHVPAR